MMGGEMEQRIQPILDEIKVLYEAGALDILTNFSSGCLAGTYQTLQWLVSQPDYMHPLDCIAGIVDVRRQVKLRQKEKELT